MAWKSKEARDAYGKKWYQENRDKVRVYGHRSYLKLRGTKHKRHIFHLKTKRKMSFEEYTNLLIAQNNVCAICQKPETEKYRGEVRNLSVDHNHATQKNRGLLCKKCNTAIGMLFENKEVIMRALAYLEKYE